MKLFCFADSGQQATAEKYLLPTLARFNEFDVAYETTTEKSNEPVLRVKARRVLAFAQRAQRAGDTHFVWADNDIVVLKPFRKRLEQLINGYDVVFQSAADYLCAGFFIAQLNPAFLTYWEAVVNKDECYADGGTGDQDAADKLRKTAKVNLLPHDEFWTPCLQAPATTGDKRLETYVPAVPACALIVHMCCVQNHHKIRGLDHCLTL